jgi:hypothetical protein
MFINLEESRNIEVSNDLINKMAEMGRRVKILNDTVNRLSKDYYK